MDINSKRFELELQFAAEKSMNVEQKIRLIEYLLKAFSDFLQETLLVDVFGAKDPDETSGIVGTARETFTTTINNDFIPTIQPVLSKFICNMDVSGMMSKIKDVATGKVKPKDLFKDTLSGAGEAMKDAVASKGEGEGKSAAATAAAVAEAAAATSSLNSN